MIYSIGDVEELTGIKTHVLRYWEDVVPSFTPQKDVSGRRTYTQHDLEIIFRLKYLINEKKFTAEGAGLQILEEAQYVQDNAEIIQQIREARRELSEIYFMVKNFKQNETN
ncbi:MAG: MerR family transcriptional regulator [Treponema sp.]|nr:MerR family transcriptional regulator [Treponema sp.]